MRVTLDGRRLEGDHPTLVSALGAAATAAEARGRLVVEAKADGIVLSQAQLNAAAEYAGAIAELHLTSALPGEIVSRAFQSAADGIGRIIPLQQAVAELIHQGRTQQALTQLQTALLTWTMVKDTVQNGAALLKRDLNALSTSSGDITHNSLDQCTQNLAALLTQTKQALAAEDWSCLGDIVAYDFDALSCDWRSMLGTLAANLARSENGP